jgi:hypothetical protein
MNFLFPAFLLASAAIAIPILLHFRRQPPQKAVPFSSLMFLEQTPVPPRTRRKLEDWLLLALRCLALLLLAMMFARPFFRGDKQTVPATGTRWCVLLDTSASMQRPGAWDAAAKQFHEAIDAVSEEDSVEFVAFDRAPRVVVSAQAWRGTPVGARKALLKSSWAQAKPTWAGTDLGKALLFAAGQLSENSNAAAASARIVLISDLQEGASLEALHAGSWPEGVSVTPRVVAAPWQDNFSLSPAAALAVEEAAEVPTTGSSQVAEVSQLRVRVTSSRESKNNKFSLMWKEGGERVEATIPPGGSRMLPAPVRVKPDADGLLELKGDTLDFDNRIHVARPHVREIEVLCLGDNLSRTDTASPFFYLARALGPTPAVKPTLTAKTAAEVTAADLVRAQVVLVFGDAEREKAALLRNWTAQGNPLVCLPATARHVGLLREVLGEATLAMKEAPGDALLQDLRFEHPMLRVFAESGVRDFTRIRFWKHRVMELPEATMKKADVLAKFDDGSVAWAEFPLEKGRVLCMTSSWSPSDSQMAVASKFVPLLFGMLDWALGDIATPRGGVVGDAIAAQLGGWTSKVPVVRPDGKTVTWDASTQAQFTDTDVPGIYRIGEGAAARSVAINLAAGEGRVAPIDEQQLVAVGVKLEKLRSASQAASDAVAQLRLEDAQHEQRQKGWKTLLVAALVVLLLETWLAGRREGRGRLPAPEPA